LFLLARLVAMETAAPCRTTAMGDAWEAQTGSAEAPERRAALRMLERGRALGERLKNAAGSGGRRSRKVTLKELRGSTGAVTEGHLRETSGEGAVCCVRPFGLGRPRAAFSFYAVKGAWLLKFKDGSAGAKCCGVPIPLDGATVRAAEGSSEFEVSNVHVKDHFLGKGMSSLAGDTFVHTVHCCFAAPNPESRDEWVRTLQAHVWKLAQRQARKILATESSGQVSQSKSLKTTATAAAVNSSAAESFVDFEEEEEFAVLGQRRPDLVGPFSAPFF